MIIDKFLLYKNNAILASTILENKDAIVLNTETLRSFINETIDENIKGGNAKKDCKEICDFECISDSESDKNGTYKKPFSIRFTDESIKDMELNMHASDEIEAYLYGIVKLYKFDETEKKAIDKIIGVFNTIGRLVDFIYFI